MTRPRALRALLGAVVALAVVRAAAGGLFAVAPQRMDAALGVPVAPRSPRSFFSANGSVDPQTVIVTASAAEPRGLRLQSAPLSSASAQVVSGTPDSLGEVLVTLSATSGADSAETTLRILVGLGASPQPTGGLRAPAGRVGDAFDVVLQDAFADAEDPPALLWLSGETRGGEDANGLAVVEGWQGEARVRGVPLRAERTVLSVTARDRSGNSASALFPFDVAAAASTSESTTPVVALAVAVPLAVLALAAVVWRLVRARRKQAEVATRPRDSGSITSLDAAGRDGQWLMRPLSISTSRGPESAQPPGQSVTADEAPPLRQPIKGARGARPRRAAAEGAEAAEVELGGLSEGEEEREAQAHAPEPAGRTPLDRLREGDVDAREAAESAAPRRTQSEPEAADVALGSLRPLRPTRSDPNLQALTGPPSPLPRSESEAALSASTPLSGPRSALLLSPGAAARSLVTAIRWEEVRVLQPIGRGGFGLCFLAEWRGSRVVVKRPARRDEGELAQLAREAEVMAVVGWHANTVPFVGACWTPPNECLLTEYMPNGTVERVLVRERQFGREEDLPRVLQMALDAARGVLHLHKEGVVHGDIATRNLFLDRDHRVRVGDFGLARLAAAATAATAAGGSGAVGPLKWMAPESVRMRALSEKSDVWMFGVALWEMFARGEPFPELAPLAAAAFVAKGGRLPLPNSAQPNPLFPQRIAALIARCWAERPDERPDMSAVVNELAAARDATQRSFGRMQPAPSMSASPSHGPQPSVYDRVPSLEFLQDKEYAGPEAQRRASQAQAQAQAQPQPQPQPQVQPPRTAPA